MQRRKLLLNGHSLVNRQLVEGQHVLEVSLREATACPLCGGTELKRWGVRKRCLPDVPIRGTPVLLEVAVRRYRCQACERVFTQAPPGVADGHEMTERLRQWLLERAPLEANTELARRSGVHESTVRLVLRQEVALAHA